MSYSIVMSFLKTKYQSVIRLTKYTLFHTQHFYEQHQAEIGKKNQANAKQRPEAELLLFENYSLTSSTLFSKNYRFSINFTKNKYLCLSKVIIMINGNENEDENEK